MRLILALLLFATGVFAASPSVAVTPSGDTVLLYSDGTYHTKAQVRDDPRLKNLTNQIGKKYSASTSEVKEAYSLALGGWRYSLPQPKSAQAAWGNSDGRTTWWYGYWKNTETGGFSSTKPILSKSGIWVGDGQDMAGYYRRGGSPPYPTKLERILSEL